MNRLSSEGQNIPSWGDKLGQLTLQPAHIGNTNVSGRLLRWPLRAKATDPL